MIYVYNPSPARLTIMVNQVPVQGVAVASPAPSYAPGVIAVKYGPTGTPPNGIPDDLPHFVPWGWNQLFTNYTSTDPHHEELGIRATFNFYLNSSVLEVLMLFCFRNSLWILDENGNTLQTVKASSA